MKCLVDACPHEGLERGLYGLCAEHQGEVAERRKELEERVASDSYELRCEATFSSPVPSSPDARTAADAGHGYTKSPTVAFTSRSQICRYCAREFMETEETRFNARTDGSQCCGW